MHDSNTFTFRPEDYIEARIENLSLSNVGFIVFLKTEDGRILPIVIGPTEAQSIVAAYNNQDRARPLTHDMMKTLLEQLDCQLLSVCVTAIEESTFYGRMLFQSADSARFDIDSRPSDAIALAIRYAVPIYVHQDVMESASIPAPEEDPALEDIEVVSPEPAPEGRLKDQALARLRERLELAEAEGQDELARDLRVQIEAF